MRKHTPGFFRRNLFAPHSQSYTWTPVSFQSSFTWKKLYRKVLSHHWGKEQEDDKTGTGDSETLLPPSISQNLVTALLGSRWNKMLCHDPNILSIFNVSLIPILLGPEGLTFSWVMKNSGPLLYKLNCENHIYTEAYLHAQTSSLKSLCSTWCVISYFGFTSCRKGDFLIKQWGSHNLILNYNHTVPPRTV